MYYTWTLVNAILNLSIIGNTHILLSNYSKLSVETQKTSTLSHPSQSLNQETPFQPGCIHS